MSVEQNDSSIIYYPVFSNSVIPLNVLQADSLDFTKKEIGFTTSIFTGHSLQATKPIKLLRVEHTITDWFSGYLLITLLITSLISQLYRKRFKITINAIWQNRFFNQINTESRLFDHPLNLILFLLYAANISFLATLTLQNLLPIAFQNINTNVLFGIITLALLIFSFAKTSSAIFTSKLFKQDEFASIYISHLHISENNVGIILLPFLWVLLYQPFPIFFQINILIVLLLGVFRIVKTFFSLSTLTRLSTYQIFLYLCTVEILPLIVLVKIILLRA